MRLDSAVSRSPVPLPPLGKVDAMFLKTRNFRLQRAFAPTVLILAVAACNGGPGTDPDTQVQTAAAHSGSRLSVNGISFEGSHFGPSTIHNGHLRTQISGHPVSLDGSRLRVDGTDYGTVAPGDTVTVTDHGKVLVNGKPVRHD